jgi:DNA-binding NtrC family response regulator
VTAAKAGRILVVDDDPGIVQLLAEFLDDQGFAVSSAGTAAGALRAVEESPPDILLLDLGLPDAHGSELLPQLRKRWPGMPVMVVTGQNDMEMAVQCMRMGAYDYVSKPFDLQEMLGGLRATLKRSALEKEASGLRLALEGSRGLNRMLGDSAAMGQLKQQLRQVAGHDISVLLVGESGTGKEAAAEALHDLSPRQKRPFVALDCGALPEHLLESELFGHEKGAFTGAVARKKGRIEAAEGGTLFLDEAANLPLGLQAKLLRFLQSRQLQRLGASTALPSDVRVLAATNADLLQAVAQGRFRQDLYYRLNEVQVRLPPLRERRGDVAELARAFSLRESVRFGRPAPEFSGAALLAMEAYPWPGNVRELQNVVRAACLTAAAVVQAEHLPWIREAAPAPLPAIPTGGRLADALQREWGRVEKTLAEQALKKHGGHRGAMAADLGVDAKTLQALLRKHALEPA